jgi:hypothetical protein
MYVYIQPGEDSQNRTSRTGQPKMNIQMGTGKTGYAEELRQHDRQKNRTARTVLPGQDWPDKTGRTGLPR